MKKIMRAISTLLALGVVAISFLGCPSPTTDTTPTTHTYTGTVKVKIFNNTTVPFTVEDISCLDFSSTYGSYSTETVIAPSGNREFEIECSHTTSSTSSGISIIPAVNHVKINGYYNSGSTVAYPYAGYISDDSTDYYYSSSGTKVRINDYSYSISPYFHLSESDSATKNIIMNFVETNSGEYILREVK